MKKYLLRFFQRGVCAMGFGPIVLAIIYSVMGAAGKAEALAPREVSLGILSITLLAFVAAGVTVVYQIERLPLITAILIHGGVLYLDYLALYLLNNWLKRDLTAVGVFTLIFVSGYALIWLCIYLYHRRKALQINQKLPGNSKR